MEIPVSNRISNLETSICTLHRPYPLLSKLLSLSGIDTIPKPSSFCKWSALILVILASFGAIVNMIIILIIRFRKEDSNTLLRPLLYDDGLDDSCSSDDADDDDSECDADEEDDEPATSEKGDSPVDDGQCSVAVFTVKGFRNQWSQNRSSNLRQWRSFGEQLSELSSSKSVVKLWENLGLGSGLGLQGESSTFIDRREERKANVSSSSFLPPPSVNYTSAATWSPLPSVRLWDTRTASKKPAILTEWGPLFRNVDAIGYGALAKLYLRDGGELAAVGAIRRDDDPLDNLTESDIEKWWPSLLAVVGQAGMALTPP